MLQKKEKHLQQYRKTYLYSFVFCNKNPLFAEDYPDGDGHCIIKTTRYMAIKTKNQYNSPKCEVLNMNTEEVWLNQTSYHYEPGWDD